METKPRESSGDQAARDLEALAIDRKRLAANYRVPWALLASVALITTWLIAHIALDQLHGTATANWDVSVLFLALILLATYLMDRDLGIRASKTGVECWPALLGYLSGFVILNGVALAGANLGLMWLIIAACAADFVLSLGMLAWSYHLMAQAIAHE